MTVLSSSDSISVFVKGHFVGQTHIYREKNRMLINLRTIIYINNFWMMIYDKFVSYFCGINISCLSGSPYFTLTVY